MLVLTRKTDEAVAIGSAGQFEHLLKITVLGIGHGTVRLGFEVDSSVPVHRWEVWQRIHGKTAMDIPVEVFESTILQ
jgi:carbon storage regulator CsrA